MKNYAPITTLKLNARSAIDIKIAHSILRSGGIVALPTETVYGLAANAFNEAAIDKIFSAKNRPQNNPLILHTHNLLAAKELFSHLSEQVSLRFHKLAEAFWPGPLTIVGPKAENIPLKATGGLMRVAVRIPEALVTLKILEELSFPLVMPSANLSTRPSPTTAMHVLKTLAGRIDAVLDDGPCSVGIESTVISIDKDKVELLRLGKIQAKDIAQVLGEEVQINATTKSIPECPGQNYLHYAPKVKKVILADCEMFREAWYSDNTLITTTTNFATAQEEWGARKAGYSMPLSDKPHNFAQELYNALYDAEEHPDKNLVVFVPRDEAWDAVNDRLKRSSAAT